LPANRIRFTGKVPCVASTLSVSMTLTWIRAAEEDVMIRALEKGSQVFPPIRIVLRVDSNATDSQEAKYFACVSHGRN
jgi:hypothetical protein